MEIIDLRGDVPQVDHGFRFDWRVIDSRSRMVIFFINAAFAWFLVIVLYTPQDLMGAEIFKWIDEKGVTHYSEHKPPESITEFTAIEFENLSGSGSSDSSRVTADSDYFSVINQAKRMEASRLERERLKLEQQRLRQQQRSQQQITIQDYTTPLYTYSSAYPFYNSYYSYSSYHSIHPYRHRYYDHIHHYKSYGLNTRHIDRARHRFSGLIGSRRHGHRSHNVRSRSIRLR